MSEDGGGAPAPEPAPAHAPPGAWRRYRGLVLRLCGLGALLGGFWLIAWRTGLLATLSSLEGLRALVERAGPLGWLIYAVVFVLGEVVYLPAILFIGLGAAIWGKAQAFALGYSSGLLSATAGFAVGRLLGTGLDQAPAWMRRLDDRLASRGFRTVFYLRLVFWLSPFLNVGLGVTRVRFRDYLLGTAIGTFAPVLLLTTIFHDTVARGESPASLHVAAPIAGFVVLVAYAIWRRDRITEDGRLTEPKVK